MFSPPCRWLLLIVLTLFTPQWVAFELGLTRLFTTSNLRSHNRLVVTVSVITRQGLSPVWPSPCRLSLCLLINIVTEMRGWEWWWCWYLRLWCHPLLIPEIQVCFLSGSPCQHECVSSLLTIVFSWWRQSLPLQLCCWSHWYLHITLVSGLFEASFVHCPRGDTASLPFP
jgi:hypothetical protein